MRRVVVLALLSAVACSGKNDPEKQIKAARSWHATVDLVATAMRVHKVTPTYAKQVAEVAEDELKKSKSLDRETSDALEAAQKLRDECERRK